MTIVHAKAVNGTKCLKLRLGADESISAVESISGVIMKACFTHMVGATYLHRIQRSSEYDPIEPCAYW